MRLAAPRHLPELLLLLLSILLLRHARPSYPPPTECSAAEWRTKQWMSASCASSSSSDSSSCKLGRRRARYGEVGERMGLVAHAAIGRDALCEQIKGDNERAHCCQSINPQGYARVCGHQPAAAAAAASTMCNSSVTSSRLEKCEKKRTQFSVKTEEQQQSRGWVSDGRTKQAQGMHL